MPRPSSPRSMCPVNHALEIFGDRWTMLVVRDMIFNQKSSFSQLREMAEGIATNILSDRLTQLEAAGIITKHPDESDGRRYHYSLTQHGRGLIPVLLELMVWSRRHNAKVNLPRSVLQQITADRDAAVAEIERRLDASDAQARSASEG
ncbi:MAG: helix-turn-helix domain-containing protein [Pseudomonadota bacterium]